MENFFIMCTRMFVLHISNYIQFEYRQSFIRKTPDFHNSVHLKGLGN